MILLSLPLPPSGNRASRTGKGRHYTPQTVKDYQWTVAAARDRKVPTIEGEFTLDITIYPWRGGGVDLDNRLKVLLDSLQHAGFYRNDKDCTLITVRRGAVIRPDGAAVVVIE